MIRRLEKWIFTGVLCGLYSSSIAAFVIAGPVNRLSNSVAGLLVAVINRAKGCRLGGGVSRVVVGIVAGLGAVLVAGLGAVLVVGLGAVLVVGLDAVLVVGLFPVLRAATNRARSRSRIESGRSQGDLGGTTRGVLRAHTSVGPLTDYLLDRAVDRLSPAAGARYAEEWQEHRQHYSGWRLVWWALCVRVTASRTNAQFETARRLRDG